MKKLLYLFILLPFLISCQNSEKKTDKKTQETTPLPMLVGKINLDSLKKEPYSKWFDSQIKKYHVDTATLEQLDLSGINAVVVFGTWCGDSKREVPRFVKIAQTIGFENYELIAVDHHKKAKGTHVAELNIERVPTFIFYRDSVELGRIIESPKTSLEMDLYEILN